MNTNIFTKCPPSILTAHVFYKTSHIISMIIVRLVNFEQWPAQPTSTLKQIGLQKVLYGAHAI